MGTTQKTTTKKKVKVIGTEVYINAATGETKEMQVVDIKETDFDFYKVWMRNFISTLGILSNQKTKICYWIIDNINKDNQLLHTYRSMADETNTSYQTVATTMKALLDADFLRKGTVGYIVNPNIIFKGAKQKRLNVLNEYHVAERKELTKEEKIDNLEKQIQTLTKQLEKLKNEKEESVA